MLQTGDWSPGAAGPASLFWNPGAISYLAELLLALVMAGYMSARVFREWRQGRLYPPTLLLAVLMVALIPAFLASMSRVLTAGGWVSYAMPWSPLDALPTLAMPWARPFAGVTAAAHILFAYQFPGPLRGARLESRAMAVLLAVLLAVEVAIAVRTDLAIVAREAWWRPDWITGWMFFGMIWTAIVFARQLAAAQRGSMPAGRAGFGEAFRSIWRRPANREAKAARAFILITLLPIVYTTALFLPNEGQFGHYPIDVLICWVVLLQLVALALVLVGYLPERSSFLFKLTAISLAVLLAAINGASWIVAPVYQQAFRASEMVASGRALRFTPRGDGGYGVEPIAFAPHPVMGRTIGDAGARVALRFPMRFYGRFYQKIHVGDRGTIGFDHIPHPVDAAFGQGVQPAIYPLLVDVPESGTRISVHANGERVLVNRLDRCTAEAADSCYRVQAILFADGRIEFHYFTVPPDPRFWLFSPMHAPWLVGITPGADATSGPPLLRDYYREFLAYLDRLYAPIVGLAIGATLVVLLGMPLLFRGFLIRPLDRLLDGIRRFRDGDLATQVAVSFNDEIGYLTDSFNEMARERHAMTQGLENRVADRVAEIEAMTVRNAQLEERDRLSAELHDAVAQTISSASLLANALPAQMRDDREAGLETATRVARLSRHALAEMQLLLKELRSTGGNERSLTDRLAELVRSFAELHALDIDCELEGDAALPAEVRATIYRVTQEGLNNIVKHSGATRVHLQFEGLEDRALLVLGDDGRGFDPAEMERSERMGLTIMRDRSRRIGATLEIESRPGHGCRITMIWIR